MESYYNDYNALPTIGLLILSNPRAHFLSQGNLNNLLVLGKWSRLFLAIDA